MKGIRETDNGILVDIEVSTRSYRFEISGYNQWRERVEIKIKSPPLKGKANKEIVNQFSKLTSRNVKIVSGHKSRFKTLKIMKMSKNELIDILSIDITN